MLEEDSDEVNEFREVITELGQDRTEKLCISSDFFAFLNAY